MKVKKLWAVRSLVLLVVLTLLAPNAVTGKFVDQSGGYPLLEFPAGGGSLSTFKVTVPTAGTVLAAQMNITPSKKTWPTTNITYEYVSLDGSTWNHGAWKGARKNVPPQASPESLKPVEAGIAEYQALEASDDVRMIKHDSAPWPIIIGQGPVPQHQYHHFEFNISTSRNTIDNIYVHWEGSGFVDDDVSFSQCAADLFVWDPGQNIWKKLDSYVQACASPTDVVLGGAWDLTEGPRPEFDDAVNVLVMGPWTGTSNDVWIYTDHVKIAVKSKTSNFPHDLEVDVNADGTVEHTYEGSVNETIVFGRDEGFVDALQHVINATQGQADTMDVPIRFTSSTTGRLTINSVLIDVDTPPFFSGMIEDITMDEDVSVPDAIDLLDYFHDDEGAENLTYTIVWLDPAPVGRIDVVIGEDLKVDIIQNVTHWTGTGLFFINGTDRCGQTDVSNLMMLTVTPINDDPVIETIGNLTAYEEREFSFKVNATDPDGDDLLFLDDSDLFMILPESGLIKFTPTDKQIGVYPVNITVMDNNGSIVNQFFTLTVANVNDEPTVKLFRPTDGLTIDSTTARLIWLPEDADGDKLTFNVFLDDGTGMALVAQGLPDSEYRLTGLKNGTTYTWTVEAFDGHVKSKRPEPFIFKVLLSGGGGGTTPPTQPNQPPTVSLISPPDGDELKLLQPTLIWEGEDPDEDPLTYEVLVLDERGYTVLQRTVENTYFTFPDALEYDEAYSWTVTPNDGEDIGACLNGPWHFTIKEATGPGVTPPVISVDVHPEGDVDIGTNVIFDASGTQDPDGIINLYIWSFGDGNTLTGPIYANVSHTFEKGGDFNVTLFVFDDDGLTAQWTYTITVKAEPPPPPPPPPDPTVGGLTMRQLFIALLITALVAAMITGAVLRAQRKIKYESYKVEQVFLVFKDGRLIEHAGSKKDGMSDEDAESEKEVMGGMLTAVQEFVAHSLKDEERKGSLRELEYEDYKIVIERGEWTFLAAFVHGHATKALRDRMRSLLNEVEAKNRAILETWSGVRGEFKGVDDAMQEMVRSASYIPGFSKNGKKL